MDIKVDKAKMTLTAFSGLNATLQIEIGDRAFSLWSESGLNLDDITKVKDMCNGKEKAILYAKDKKVGKLAKLILKNIKGRKIPFVDDSDKPGITMDGSNNNIITWPQGHGKNSGLTYYTTGSTSIPNPNSYPEVSQ